MTAEMTDRRRWLALYVLCAGVLMIVLDATVVNVALPSIQDDLGFSQTSLAWVVNAYLIAFGGLLLLGGRIGDLIGHRRIFLIGLTVFTAASLLCALTQTQGMLIAARFIQGAGGALASAVVLGMIVTMFPEPREQAKAIGVYGFVASAGGSIGLLLGGVLTESINWHWIFFVNVPIGIATALFARRLVQARPGIGLRSGADLPGAVLMTSGLMIGVYAILQVSEKGWTSGEVLGLGALSLVLLTAFVLRQARIANPLMPLRLFRSRNVSGANLVLILLVVGMFSMFFLGALYLQRILGYDPLDVGLAFPVLMQLAMSDATPSDMGLASGLANTTPQIGGAVGLALLATIAADRTETLLSQGESSAVALNGGFHVAYLVGAALVLVAIAVALTVLQPVAHPMTAPGEAPEGEQAHAAEPVYSEA
jgi:EmrB/QacA subfamily drug resistance transporter